MTLVKLCKSYIFSFGVLHIMAAVLGWWLIPLGRWGSFIGLVLVGGIGLCFTIFYTNRYYRGAFFLCFCLAWIIEWGRIFTWMPPWESIQYYLVSFLNLACAVALFYLIEEEHP